MQKSVTYHGNILPNYELNKTRKHRASHSAPHFELVAELAPLTLEQLGLLQEPL